MYPTLEGTRDDINVTVSDVVDILRRQLGVPPAEPPLQESYPWKITRRQRRQRRRARRILLRGRS